MDETIVNGVQSGSAVVGHAHAENVAVYKAIQRLPSGAPFQINLLAATNACLRRHLKRISQLLKQEEYLAYHDALTGLPSRSLLQDRLRQAMRQAMRQDMQVLLLFIDLDGFRWVNAKLGHVLGDQLLQQVAARLVASIRSADTACRYGGDEFVVMLPDIDGQHSVTAAVSKIRAQLAAPYRIGGRVITLSASIGAAVYRGDEQSFEDLIQQADIEMYRAKSNSDVPTIVHVGQRSR